MIHRDPDFHGHEDEEILDQFEIDARKLTDIIIDSYEVAERIETAGIAPTRAKTQLSIPDFLLDRALSHLPHPVRQFLSIDSLSLEILFEHEFETDRPSLSLQFSDASSLSRSIIIQRNGGDLATDKPFTVSFSGTEEKEEIDELDIGLFMEELAHDRSAYLTSEGVVTQEKQFVADPQYPPIARYLVEALIEQGADSSMYKQFDVEVDDTVLRLGCFHDGGQITQVCISKPIASSFTISDGIPMAETRRQGAEIELSKWTHSVKFHTEVNEKIEPYDGDNSDMVRLEEDIAALKTALRQL